MEKWNEFEYEIPQKLSYILLNNPFIGICITDGAGKVIAVNEAQTRITSISADQFIGKCMKDLVKNKLLNESSSVEVLKKQEEVYMKQTLRNGKSYLVRGVPIFYEDSIEYVVSYLLDVSDLETAKEKMQQLEADKHEIEYKYEALKIVLDHSDSIIYQSKVMQGVVELSKRVADSDAAVLITGPSGAGKELIANLIHNESKRKNKPFIKINCAAIPEQLLESELFGYESGTFTGGSSKGKKGIFEYADGGSLLLDEIGEMPLSLQTKLLRVLQDHEIRRIGGNKTIRVDIRLIASTNACLKQLISEKKFRQDLYYRINVIEIRVPSLSKRKDDIPLLIQHFIRLFNAKYSVSKTIQWEALKYLASNQYPGNVRELSNVIERLIVQSTEDIITLKDSYEALGLLKFENGEKEDSINLKEMQGESLKQIMAKYESRILGEYMKIYKNGVTVAEKLKTDQSTISRKLARYNI